MIKRLASIVVLMGTIVPVSGKAETVFYGAYTRVVEIRNDDPTLFIFDSVPLSAACQPADVVSFELLSKDKLTEVEDLQVRSSTSRTKQEPAQFQEDLTSRMIRVKPLTKSGMVRCSFPMDSGENVGIEMQLRSDVVRPLIQFKSISTSRLGSPEQERGDRALALLRSMRMGKPLGLLDETKKYPRFFSSDLARYKIRYVGTDGMYRVVKITGKAREKIDHEKLSVLSMPTGVGMYSAVLPQREIREDEQFTLLVVSRDSLSPAELRRALR